MNGISSFSPPAGGAGVAGRSLCAVAAAGLLAVGAAACGGTGSGTADPAAHVAGPTLVVAARVSRPLGARVLPVRSAVPMSMTGGDSRSRRLAEFRSMIVAQYHVPRDGFGGGGGWVRHLGREFARQGFQAVRFVNPAA